VDVLVGVLGLEEEELRGDHVGALVVHLGAQEDDALPEESRVDVEGSLVAAVRLDDHRD